MEFIKYHSLENDFILINNLDASFCLNKKEQTQKITQLCNRHSGIGADGILVLDQPDFLKFPRVTIFNSNGNPGGLCLNGLRCIAHYLFTAYNYPSTIFLFMNERLFTCTISTSSAHALTITTIIESFSTKVKPLSLSVQSKLFSGLCIDIGNPHFVIMQPISLEELSLYGPALEKASLFPKKTNVEFIWKDHERATQETPVFNLLVYERDCGITQACSSGAVASCIALLFSSLIAPKSSCVMKMLGGELHCTVIDDKKISITAQAHKVFTGNSDLL